ncbi:axonemal dynein light intermediate polypeptide 1-like [Aulostomus maculatus]
MASPSDSLLKYDRKFKIDRKSGSRSSQVSVDSTEENLNFIFPPKEWMDGGQLLVQQVSADPSTEAEVVNLQERLDRKLKEGEASQTGICPVRRELYSQLFDELIRQVTISCVERGLLLARVREENKKTVDSYQKLHKSLVSFGVRRQLQAHQENTDLEKRISELRKEKQDLTEQLKTLRAQSSENEKRENERRLGEAERRAKEIQLLKESNEQIKAQLFKIILPKKSL